MNDYVGQLFKQIESRDQMARRNAIVELAMMLEKNTVIGRTSSAKDFVPPIKEISLDKQEQQEIVNNITHFLNRDLQEPSLIWALGKAHVEMGLKPLLKYVNQCGSVFDEEVQRQTVSVLNNYLSGPVYEISDWRRREIELYPNLFDLVDKWSTVTLDEGLKDLIKRLCMKILQLQQKSDSS